MLLYLIRSRGPLAAQASGAFRAVYFTFVEFPEWFRVRSKNWFTFAYVLHKDMKNINASESVALDWVFSTLYVNSEIHTVGLYVYSGGAKGTLSAVAWVLSR